MIWVSEALSNGTLQSLRLRIDFFIKKIHSWVWKSRAGADATPGAAQLRAPAAAVCMFGTQLHFSFSKRFICINGLASNWEFPS